MEKCKMEISKGVEALLANAHTESSSKKCYFFEGDWCQMFEATKVAEKLGIEVKVKGGLPYIESEDGFKKVIQYILMYKISGYWHYQK